MPDTGQRTDLTRIATIADAVADGKDHLVVVGVVPETASFAGLHVEKGAPQPPYVARIRRP